MCIYSYVYIAPQALKYTHYLYNIYLYVRTLFIYFSIVKIEKADILRNYNKFVCLLA